MTTKPAWIWVAAGVIVIVAVIAIYSLGAALK